MKINFFTTNISQINSSVGSDTDKRKKNSFSSTKNLSFGSKELTVNDFKYKIAILKGLFERYNIKFSLDNIQSIVAPDELKELLKKFKPKDFMIGKLIPKNLFENVRAKKFRVNLHSHTKYSDGHMSIADFLSQSVAYADEVAKTKPTDSLPAYTTAITDHNVVDGVREAIFKIAQEPDKFKNMKFVPACEFMFCDTEKYLGYPYFEAVSLGLNPFDKVFSTGNSTFYDRIGLIPKMKEFGGIVSYAHPMRRCQRNTFSSKLLEFLKNIGINGIESEYQYLGFNPTKEQLEQIKHIRKITKDYGWFQTGGTDTHSTNIFHEKVKPFLETKDFDWFPKNPEKRQEIILQYTNFESSVANDNNCSFWKNITNLFKS